VDADTLRSALAAGRLRFPRMALDEAQLTRGLQLLEVAPQDLAARPGDICLSIACLAGDAGALAALEEELLSPLPRHLTRFQLDDARLAEVLQRVRVRLLSGLRPRLASYSGRAPLEAWLRVLALRTALNLMKEDARHEGQPASLERLVDVYSSPEVRAARNDVRPAFEQALKEALAALSSQQRTVLRLHFLDELNIDAIGRVFRVHRATVARWLVAIRTDLFEHVRERLQLELAPSSTELRSLFHLLRSDLRVSVERLLATR
jgi:RNA polymerase sigma-70 factor (ECF subfamily)